MRTPKKRVRAASGAPTADGTEGLVLGQDEQAVQLLDSGLTVAEVVLPRTDTPEIAGLGQLNLTAR